MKKTIKSLQFERIPGGIYGLVSMSIGVSLIFLAMTQYPGYNLIEYYISYLGFGPGLSAPLFNIGLIVAGLVAIPSFLDLARILDGEEINQKAWKRAKQFSIAACIFLSLVGCFPAYNLILLIFHGMAAMGFFVCGFLFCVLFTYLMNKDTRFSRIQIYIGIIVSGVFALFMVTIRPLTEWLVFFAIVFWVCETNLYVLFKKF